MIAAWFRRRQDDVVDELLRATDPAACPDCFGEAFITVELEVGGYSVEPCQRCDGSGKREQ